MAEEYSTDEGVSECVLAALERDDAEDLAEALKSETTNLGMYEGLANTTNDTAAPPESEGPDHKSYRRLLIAASKYNSPKCCSYLINDSENPQTFLREADADQFGKSILHYAAGFHSTQCIEALLQHGADPRARCKADLTPLQEALFSPKLHVEWDSSTSAGEILASIRDIDLSALGVLEEVSREDILPLMFSLADRLEVVPLLALLLGMTGSFINIVAKGSVYPEGGEETSGTLVDFLVSQVLWYSKRATSELSGSATSNGDASNQDERHWVAATKALECLLLFNPRLTSGADSSKASPLLRAAQANNYTVVDVLLRAGAPVNGTDGDGNTALHWALRQAASFNGRSVDSRLIRRLLEAGGNVLAGNRQGATPAHTAAGHGHFEALRMILDRETAGANVMAATKETPLHYAVKNNHLECAALLLEHGANKHVVSLRNQRPGQLATSSKMRQLLQEPESLEGSEGQQLEAIWQVTPSTWLLKVSGGREWAEDMCPREESRFRPRAMPQAAGAGGYGASAAKPPPSLPEFKTSLCRHHFSGYGCSWDDRCHFAHSEAELRSTASHKTHTSLPPAGLGAGSAPPRKAEAWGCAGGPGYKVKKCRYFDRSGSCPNGISCKFAHGDAELRVPHGAAGQWRPATPSGLAPSGTSGDDINSRKIFVGGIPLFVTSLELREAFEDEFEGLQDATVICASGTDGKPISRGFGFVTFSDARHANEACCRHYMPLFGKKIEMKRIQALDSHTPSYPSIPFPSSVGSSLRYSLAIPSSPTYSARTSLKGEEVALFNNGVQLPSVPLPAQAKSPAHLHHLPDYQPPGPFLSRPTSPGLTPLNSCLAPNAPSFQKPLQMHGPSSQVDEANHKMVFSAFSPPSSPYPGAQRLKGPSEGKSPPPLPEDLMPGLQMAGGSSLAPSAAQGTSGSASGFLGPQIGPHGRPLLSSSNRDIWFDSRWHQPVDDRPQLLLHPHQPSHPPKTAEPVPLYHLQMAFGLHSPDAPHDPHFDRACLKELWPPLGGSHVLASFEAQQSLPSSRADQSRAPLPFPPNPSTAPLLADSLRVGSTFNQSMPFGVPLWHEHVNGAIDSRQGAGSSGASWNGFEGGTWSSSPGQTTSLPPPQGQPGDSRSTADADSEDEEFSALLALLKPATFQDSKPEELGGSCREPAFHRDTSGAAAASADLPNPEHDAWCQRRECTASAAEGEALPPGTCQDLEQSHGLLEQLDLTRNQPPHKETGAVRVPSCTSGGSSCLASHYMCWGLQFLHWVYAVRFPETF